MTVPWWLPFGSVPEISGAELALHLSGPEVPVLLDVRTRTEWSQGHIAGALNVPISELRSRLDALRFDRDRAVVAICLSGHRSIPAVRFLIRQGFRAQQLQGGMLAWRRAGLPTIRDESRQHGGG